MDSGIITAIIGVVGTLLGTILGWALNCIYERKKSELRLCFSLQPSNDRDDTPPEQKTKYSDSGYCIYCYNIGQTPFFYDNMCLYYKKHTIMDCPQSSDAEAIMPYNFYVYELNMQEYKSLLHYCDEYDIKECNIIAYDISGKKCKAKLDLILPSLQASVYQDIVK